MLPGKLARLVPNNKHMQGLVTQRHLDHKPLTSSESLDLQGRSPYRTPVNTWPPNLDLPMQFVLVTSAFMESKKRAWYVHSK